MSYQYGIHSIFKLFEGNTSIVSENWRLAVCFLRSRESFVFDSHCQNTESLMNLYRPLLAFLNSDVSGKMWPRLISTELSGITPKSHQLRIVSVTQLLCHKIVTAALSTCPYAVQGLIPMYCAYSNIRPSVCFLQDSNVETRFGGLRLYITCKSAKFIEDSFMTQ